MIRRAHPLGRIISVALSATLGCIVTAAAATIEVSDLGPDSGITIRSQSAAGAEVQYRMTRFGMEPLELQGQTLQTITLPGVFLPNDAGAPDLPGMGRFLALPQGATASVEITHAERRVYTDVDVAPAPVIPKENEDGPLTYARNPAIYQRNAYYPEHPVTVSAPRTMRGVDIVALGITPFQYNPVTRELVVYTELEVRVDFTGGNGRFGEDRLRNRYWEPILERQLLNYDVLPSINFDRRGDDSRYGWEYVIICPDDPAFVAWGDTLKTWRTLQGITTEVFTTTDTGATPEAIEAWLDNAYATWDQPPVAFLILGDYPDSGDRTPGVTSPIWDGYCVSDNILADVDGDDLPDMVHARICGRDDAELGTMIGKMLSYEREPYTDAGFYDHPLIAGGWQTERWFILCCEVIAGHQSEVLGKEPVREYAIYSGAPGNVWSTNSNTDIVVEYFGPEGLGYIPATPAHLNDWGGNAEGINAAINAGTYFLMHRDHGLETGWGEPDYGNGDLAGLHNELYPFIFSINCLTGKYNWASECFAEAFHRMEHGALGVIAASETSYSFVNDTFVWGMFDALWPDFLPDYSGPYSDNIGDIELRTAFAMTYGKYFLEQSSWPSNPNSKTVTYHLFHHHGDAFMTLYSEIPAELSVYHYDTCPLNSDVFAISANEGAVIALTVDGEIIGVADATGAIQSVPIIPQTQAGELRITVTKANYYRYDVTIPIGGTAYYVNAAGTGDYPTIQAAIDAATAGVVIELEDGTYTGAGNRDLDYLGKAIQIRSRSANPAACVIDCQAGPSDMHRGVTFQNGEDGASLLAGVTIRGGYETVGGAISCPNGSPTISNCVFEENQAEGGGALHVQIGDPIFSSCTFRANVAQPFDGGAIMTLDGTTLTECTFDGNAGDTVSTLTVSGGAVTCTNCTFYANTIAAGSGSTVHTNAGAITLDNCILAFAPAGQAVDRTNEGTVNLTCCDVFGNAGGDWVGYIAGQYGVNGNFSEDPLFCDAPGGDLTISSASYCAPGAHSPCGLIGAHGVGCTPPVYQLAADGSGDFPTIQAAVDASEPGTVIELLDGIYTGPGNRDVYLGDHHVVIRSETGDATACVIDCQGTEIDPHRGFFVDGFLDTRLRLENLTIAGGFVTGTEMGGAVYVAGGSCPRLEGCLLIDCTSQGYGGAIGTDGGAYELDRCTLAGNMAAADGGGIYAAGAMASSVSSCTFYGNSAVLGSGIYVTDDVSLAMSHTIVSFGLTGEALACGGTATATLTCCDVYGNEGGDWVGCIETQIGTDGNIAEDPFFCDAPAGDFTLYDDSPCAPAENPECGQIGAWGVDCMHPYFVKPDGTGDYPTIQAAIDAAFSGLTIELDDGVFTGTGNRDLDFHGKAITLRSRSGNAEACIIDPQGSSSNVHNAFRFHTGEDEDTIVEGITMRGGFSFFGGAVFINSASPTFRRCVFLENGANDGGAIYAFYSCAPRFEQCTFSHNYASGATMGGHIFLNTEANAVLDNCLLTYAPAGMAIHVLSSSPVLTCCDIFGNTDGDWVGEIAGQYGIDGNISLDPLYCDVGAYNLKIDETSPCAPENNPECGLIGALDVGCYSSGIAETWNVDRLRLATTVPSSAAAGTTIRYAIPGSGPTQVRLSIYDASGRVVRTLMNARQTPGVYTLVWDGKGENGAFAGSGVYFCRLTSGGESRTRNVVLLR